MQWGCPKTEEEVFERRELPWFEKYKSEEIVPQYIKVEGSLTIVLGSEQGLLSRGSKMDL